MSMFDKLRQAWAEATTEANNATLCPVRIGAIGTAVVYHAGAAWMIAGQHTAVDMPMLGQYVQHMATLIGVAGASIGAKSLMGGDAK